MLDNVESYEELEILLHLAALGGPSEVAALAANLRIPAQAAQPALEALTGRGFLSSHGGSTPSYRYDPKSPVLDQAVRDLSLQYQHDRLRIIELMTANAMERLRAAALKTFADCFRLGRAKKDG